MLYTNSGIKGFVVPKPALCIPSIHLQSMAGWWRFPDVLHCHDGKADCSDVLYIFSVRMSVYHGIYKDHHLYIGDHFAYFWSNEWLNWFFEIDYKEWPRWLIVMGFGMSLLHTIQYYVYSFETGHYQGWVKLSIECQYTQDVPNNIWFMAS